MKMARAVSGSIENNGRSGVSPASIACLTSRSFRMHAETVSTAWAEVDALLKPLAYSRLL
jgi:hypothetical protein